MIGGEMQMGEQVESRPGEKRKGSGGVRVPRRGTLRSFLRGQADMVLVCAVALAVRGVYLVETSGVPFLSQLVGDAQGYYEWAQRIAAGDWLGSRSFYQAPLYPYVLAVLLRVFGESVGIVRIAQVVWGVVGVLCLQAAARRMFGRSAGLLAGMMLALCPTAIFFDGIVQKASLACGLLCVMLALMGLRDGRWGGARRCVWAVSLGVVVGLLVLVRENALVWAGVLPVWLLWPGDRSLRRGRGAVCAMYVVGLAVVLVPVGLRNRLVCGEWSVTTFQAGPNFYIGNSREADGRYRPIVPGHETPQFEREDARAVAERARGQALTPREVSRYWWQRAKRDIVTDRLRWIELMVSKVLMVVNRYEVADVESEYVYADFSYVLRGLGSIWHFGVVCPLAVVGMVYTSYRARELWIYYVLMGTMVLAVAAFFVLARYRFPLVPLLIPFAAAGCVALVRSVRDWNWRSMGAPLVAGVVVALVSNMRVHEEEALDALAYMNLGVVMATEDAAGAARFFHLAVERNPRSAEARFNLAQACRLMGDLDGAIEGYRAALALEPGLAGADFFLAQALEEAGELEEARRHYGRALVLDPRDAEARAGYERVTSP
jgi:4-amino-4-deoxy-L-arabinose transferase-like glycosyltransferase